MADTFADALGEDVSLDVLAGRASYPRATLTFEFVGESDEDLQGDGGEMGDEGDNGESGGEPEALDGRLAKRGRYSLRACASLKTPSQVMSRADMCAAAPARRSKRRQREAPLAKVLRERKILGEIPAEQLGSPSLDLVISHADVEQLVAPGSADAATSAVGMGEPPKLAPKLGHQKVITSQVCR